MKRISRNLKTGLPLFGLGTFGLGTLGVFAVLGLAANIRPALAASGGTTTVKVAAKSLAGDVAAGNTYYALNCVSCHSQAGASFISGYPRLAAQVPGYLADQLVSFRSGERKNVAMNAVASHLSDATIADLAAYLASTPPADPWPSTDAGLRESGKTLYLNGHPSTGVLACVGCHQAQGQGNAQAGFPRIGGQSPDYFKDAIHGLAQLSGKKQDNQAAMIMAGIAKAMTPAETAALDEYIKTLK